MKKVDPVLVAIIIGTVVILGGIIFASTRSANPGTQYNAADTSRPQLVIGQKLFDLGKMGVDEIREREIEVSNAGKSALVLSNFSTSCDCTFIQVVKDGVESPRFSMHINTQWQGRLEPGEKATIKVTYQPSIMPVTGKVSRSAFFKTNDPNNSDVAISLAAEVK